MTVNHFKRTLKYGEHHSIILMQLLISQVWNAYRDMYRIVKQVLRYVSYREVSVSLQP